jgi:hypothetical protein
MKIAGAKSIFLGLIAAAVVAQMVTDTRSVPAPVRPASVLIPQLSQAPPMQGGLTGSWTKAARISVVWNHRARAAGKDRTVALVGRFGDDLYVAFNCTQHGPLRMNATRNGSAVTRDDSVALLLWPDGAAGTGYGFDVNARGAHDQSSTRAVHFSPSWESTAARTASGYVAMLRIPFTAIASKSNGSWRAQFVRAIADRNLVYEWARSDDDAPFSDPQASGYLYGLDTHVAQLQDK